MAYAYRRAEGFVMITGRPGTGKTTLVGELVESLSGENVFVANLVCTQLQADDLFKSVAYSFGVGSAKLDKAELLQRLTVLLNRWHREKRRALLVVDEAQDLSPAAMEELRLLTNIQIGGQPLLQIFLLGQPELRDLILSPAMEQVHQRIVAASHIDGLEVEETEEYVMHRLNVVGWRGDPAIDRAIFPLIHKFSEGVPRRINLICSRLLLLGSVEERHVIEVKDVGVVISELQSEGLAAGTGFSKDDFEVSTQPEWVPVPVSASHVLPEEELFQSDTGHIISEIPVARATDIPLDGFPVPFTPAPVAPEIIEEATVSEEPQPTTSRAIWRRFSNFGMVVVLIGCLLFVLNSFLSNEVIERILKLVGASESLLVASAPPVSRSSAVAGTEVVRLELTAQMAGSSLQPSSLETKFPSTQPEALKEPERTFTVSFSSDSDALRSENWNALDSAVVMLGRFPDMIVLIADLSQESLGELYDSDLSSSRIGAVEHYLMAAGVNPRRLHVQEHTALKNSDGSAISSIEDTDLLNEILTINLESNRSQ